VSGALPPRSHGVPAVADPCLPWPRTPAARRAGCLPSQRASTLTAPPSPPFPDVRAVYRGFWRDEVVAVKLIDCSFTSQAGSASAAELALHEAELSKGLHHPCVVRVRVPASRLLQNNLAWPCSVCASV
jgi:hypothetical protein